MTTGVDRSQLHQIIAGLTEGVILIEPDQRITWANAAALAMHGAADLAELGGTVSAFRETFVLRYRNNHVITRTPIERVLAGETFDEVIVNVRRTDRPDFNAMQRIRSLVITDAAGVPDCLVLILADVTSQFEAEERFEKTFSANPAPAVICRLSDLRHVKVNLGFLEMTGYRSADVIGRSVYEIDVLNEARSRDLAIARLNAGETIPQMEACLRLPDGGTRFVIVAGQPIDMGDEPCMLFTFADLELRKKAETALRHSEERFATAFRLTPVPTLLCRAGGLAVIGINQAFSRTFGHDEDAVVGQELDAIGLWADDAQRERFGADLSAQGSVLGFEACLRSRDGAELDCLVSAESVTIGDEACLLAVLQDISDRKRSERELFDAIETVMADTSWFSRGLIEKLGSLRQPRSSEPAPVRPDLTRREGEVLRLICQGLGDGAIAKRLSLTPNTVRNHTAALYRKLGIHRRGEAIIWGRDNGFAS
ncbi:LuxR family transcriptional regulator [Methylobacterium sp. Leaf104]|uniref:helix-turn-helix transcriptional regulator n=1 Tax=Methylobacterium TaxID=407 RepID=UPI0007022126|nr:MULTISPECIES: helix-turn-helix transcriptional regulator [Methylobacterium]KQP41032.1 LuxR family transcriptional regulator [Methylobacterium sp. Leaf104]MCI9882580.1 helix-turn-helix transcriptional regulator [Methylobacterium goesingense]